MTMPKPQKAAPSFLFACSTPDRRPSLNVQPVKEFDALSLALACRGNSRCRKSPKQIIPLPFLCDDILQSTSYFVPNGTNLFTLFLPFWTAV